MKLPEKTDCEKTLWSCW